MRLTIVSLTAILGLTGCIAATRTTVKLAQAEKNMAAARDAGAPEQAVYAWTLADEYMKKARDEWARSDFEASESLVKKAKHWADESASIARAAPTKIQDEMDEAASQISEGANSAPEPEPEPEGQGVWQ